MTPEEMENQLRRLERRLGDLQAELDGYRINGLQDAFSGTGNQLFGGGNMRLDGNGIQFRSTAEEPQLFWLPNFSNDPANAEPTVSISGVNATDVAGMEVDIRAQHSASDFSQLLLAQLTTASGSVTLNALNGGNYVGIAGLVTASIQRLQLSGYLLLSSFTADPSSFEIIPATPLDGWLWYRSDTDKFRARINGATENLATESYADAHTSDATDAHDASAISILDTANDFTATDVEGALAELQSDNEAHVAAADPHTGYVLESLVDAKGDIIAATAADTVARLAVGTNDKVLTAASGESTGLAWKWSNRIGDGTELTIATGVITVTSGYHLVDTEADAATDDLATITAARGAGEILILRPASSARTIVVKHATGNCYLLGGADFTMDNSLDQIMLVYYGGGWIEISRSNNAA